MKPEKFDYTKLNLIFLFVTPEHLCSILYLKERDESRKQMIHFFSY